MAYDHAGLAEAVPLDTVANDAVSFVVNPAGKKTYVRFIIFHNVNTTTETVTGYIVKNSGGSEGADSETTNRFYKEDLTAGSSRIWEFPIPGVILTETNDTIQGACTTQHKVLAWSYGGQE